MTDRLLALANAPSTAPLVRLLGLPRPRILARRAGAYERLEHAGRGVLALGTAGGFALSACRHHLAEAGADLAPAAAPHAVVVDATGCATSAALGDLHALLQPAIARLRPGGRVLLLAARHPVPAEAAAAARAIEGFMRAVAKELGRRGATANCLYLAPQSLADIGPALDFFAGDRSAYVSGQALRLSAVVAGVVPASRARRVAVVTGAAGGIGAATARRLAAEGSRVICVDVPGAQPALDALAVELDGVAVPMDITADTAAAQLLAVVQPLGGIDVLVHNAGITRDRTFLRMAEAEWRSVLAVNLGAVLRIDRALDAAGALRDGAREICLASISGIAGNAGQANYAASKAALIGYVEARAASLAGRGITVNAIAPGFIETAMTRRIPFVVRELGRRLNALSQGGRPEDVAEAIAFLARPQSRAISGQTLRVCGQSLLGA